MDDSALTVDQLDALSRAVPDDTERKDIKLYLKVAILPQLCPLLLCLKVAPACSLAHVAAPEAVKLEAYAVAEQANPSCNGGRAASGGLCRSQEDQPSSNFPCWSGS